MEDRSAWMSDDRKKDRRTTVALGRERTEFIGMQLFVHLPSSLVSHLSASAFSSELFIFIPIPKSLNSTLPFCPFILSPFIFEPSALSFSTPHLPSFPASQLLLLFAPCALLSASNLQPQTAKRLP